MSSIERAARPAYDAGKVVSDMGAKGWLATDLAREAGLTDMAVSRFLRGEFQTARVAKKIALALGYTSPRRYLVTPDSAVSA